MIDFITILNSNAKKQIIDAAAEIAGTDENSFSELMRITFHEKYPLNSRAIRVVEICTSKKPELFLPYLEKSVNLYPELKIGGLKRIFPKIFVPFVHIIPEDSLSILIDCCFKQILDKNEEPAVRVNSMELMAQTAKVIPDIRPELESVIKFIYSEAPVSIKARRNSILKKFNQKCN